MRLFRRAYDLVIGDRNITGLDATFDIKKTLRTEPNSFNFTVYNLAPDTRKAFESQKDLPIRFAFGYGSDLEVLFLGKTRNVVSSRTGPDVVTEIASGDGEKARRFARVALTVAADEPAEKVLEAVATALGVGLGNLAEAKKLLAARGVGSLAKFGAAIHGNAADELTILCRSVGLEWSIQNEKLQILEKGAAVEPGKSILLSPDTGLLGSPKVDNKGVFSAESLIIPGLKPGAIIKVESEFLTGGFRISEVSYSGDTFGGDCKATLHGKRY